MTFDFFFHFSIVTFEFFSFLLKLIFTDSFVSVWLYHPFIYARQLHLTQIYSYHQLFSWLKGIVVLLSSFFSYSYTMAGCNFRRWQINLTFRFHLVSFIPHQNHYLTLSQIVQFFSPLINLNFKSPCTIYCEFIVISPPKTPFRYSLISIKSWLIDQLLLFVLSFALHLLDL